jgi:hypothetical protein
MKKTRGDMGKRGKYGKGNVMDRKMGKSKYDYHVRFEVSTSVTM